MGSTKLSLAFTFAVCLVKTPIAKSAFDGSSCGSAFPSAVRPIISVGTEMQFARNRWAEPAPAELMSLNRTASVQSRFVQKLFLKVARETEIGLKTRAIELKLRRADPELVEQFAIIADENLRLAKALPTQDAADRAKRFIGHDIDRYNNSRLDLSERPAADQPDLTNKALRHAITSQKHFRDYLLFVDKYPNQQKENGRLLELFYAFQASKRNISDYSYPHLYFNYKTEVVTANLERLMEFSGYLAHHQALVKLKTFLESTKVDDETMDVAHLVISLWSQMFPLGASTIMFPNPNVKTDAMDRLFAKMSDDIRSPLRRARLRRTLEDFFENNFELFFRQHQIFGYGHEITATDNYPILVNKVNEASAQALSNLDP